VSQHVPSAVPSAGGLPAGALAALRWAAFGLFLFEGILFAVSYLSGINFYYDGPTAGVAQFLALLGGIPAVIAAFGGWAQGGRRVAGGLLAIGYLLLQIVVFAYNWGFVASWGSDGLAGAMFVTVAVYVLYPVLGFISWGLSRPFAGGGWLGILPAAVVGVFGVVLQAMAYQGYLGWMEGAFKAMAVLVPVSLVGSAVLGWALERPAFARLRAQRTGGAAPGTAPYRGPLPAAYDPALAGRTNTLAILALVFGLLGSSIVPIVLGFVALGQIRRTGEQGRGMAIAGVVLGFIGIGVLVILLIVYFGYMFAAFGASSYYY
jgi:hypothetical protein